MVGGFVNHSLGAQWSILMLAMPLSDSGWRGCSVGTRRDRETDSMPSLETFFRAAFPVW
jgi:hypothetical protein